MKLHAILGRILTDVALRHANPGEGICALIDQCTRGMPWSEGNRIDRAWEHCCQRLAQTDTWVFPVAPDDEECQPSAAFVRASDRGTTWRGQYGRNRRQFLRDCWHYAKEHNL